MSDKITCSALGSLILLQLTMLFALYFKIPPHPPETIPLGGMAPVLGMSLSAALAALIFRHDRIPGAVFMLLAVALAALSYGPQKYTDPAFALVWPAVITAQIAMLALLGQLLRSFITPPRMA